MGSITGLTAERMLAIEAASVVSGTVNGSNHLILTTHGGSDIDAGNVVGPAGSNGTNGTDGSDGSDGARGSEWFDYIGSGTPTGITGMLSGDYCLRSDGEVFKYNGSAWIDTTISTKGPAGASPPPGSFAPYAIGVLYGGGNSLTAGGGTIPLNSIFCLGGAAVAGDFNTSTYTWTCPTNGIYSFTLWMNVTGGAGIRMFPTIYGPSDQGSMRGLDQEVAAQGYYSAMASGDAYCAPGVQVFGQYYCASSGPSFASIGSGNYMTIHRVA